MEKTPFNLEIPRLDESIFKHKLIPSNPANNNWSSGVVTYVPRKFESIKGVGNFVYYYGIDLPSKTIAPVEAIFAIGPVKRRFINSIKLMASKEAILPLIGVLLMGRKQRGRFFNKVCQYFNEESETTMRPYYLDDLYCSVVKEIQKFFEVFLTAIGVEIETAKYTAEIIGCMFEFDNAYRYPGQDALNETTKERLLKYFPQEVERLVQLNRDRVPNRDASVPVKFKAVGKVLSIAWIFIPWLRNAIKKGIESMNWDNVKLDEADIFHTLLFGDYDTRGLSLQRRIEIYEAMYPDISKRPPRVIVTNK